MRSKPFRIGTRGSDLALAQTQMVIDALSRAGFPAEKHIIKTQGDKDHRPFSEISGDGFFTKELERALLCREIDFAVHSAKDLPSITHESLPWRAFSTREDAGDILIADANTFDSLGHVISGKKIGTASPRRALQIQDYLGDVEIVSLRGNVPTRIQKVIDGELDGIILAKAGVLRLQLMDEIKSHGLVVKELSSVTAPCQGIISIQCSQEHVSVLEQISNSQLDVIAKTEKSILSLLGGGCQLPLGAHITKDSQFHINFYLGGREESLAFDFQAETLGTLLRELVKKTVNSPADASHRVWFAQPVQHILKPASFAAHLGLEPVAWPLLEVCPIWKEQDFKEFVTEQKRYGGISFSSQFAVQLFMTELEPYLDLKTWLSNIKVFAVGPATRKKLEEYGITDVILANEAHGKALASLLEKTQVRGDILIPGQVGSLVKRRLNGFGPHTKGLTLYRMRPSRNPMSLELPNITDRDHIVLTSPSAVKEFVIRCQKHPDLKRVNVWAFGPSTSRELGFLGIQYRTNPASGSWEAVLKAIKKT